MINLLYILAAILILGFIVTAHELGHYIVGRLTGIGILEFSVGFGPKILGWRRKGIAYSLRGIPLGGYCKFAGVEDGQAERPDAMEKQPVWKRFFTVLSGPLMNFVLAFVFVWIILTMVGLEMVETVPVIGQVSVDMPAEEAGFQVGDAITEANGEEISQDIDGVLALQQIISQAGESPIAFTLLRGDQELQISVTPKMSDDGENVRPMIGIVFDTQTVGIYRYSPLKAIPESASYMVRFTGMMLDSLKNLVFKGEGLEEMSGPVGIISFMSVQVRQGWGMVCNLVFVLSLNLGIMNLLPLPGLDGGRLVFLAVEGIRRKPVPPEKEGLVHGIGLLLLLVLIGFITFHDIVKLISG